MSEFDSLIEDFEGPPPMEEEVDAPEPVIDFTPLEKPYDIEKVWGSSADLIIAHWGVHEFRSSAIHRRAIEELERQERHEPLRRLFLKGMKK